MKVAINVRNKMYNFMQTSIALAKITMKKKKKTSQHQELYKVDKQDYIAKEDVDSPAKI